MFFFAAAPAVSFSACAGLGSCTVLTDASGLASTYVTVLKTGVMNITAQLAPASYKNPQFVQTTLLGTSSSLDISLVPAFAWMAQGATLDLPLTARVLSSGVPQGGRTVNFQVVKGTGTLSSATATADASGYASTTLHLAALGGDIQVSACVAPDNVPCQIFSGTAVPASALQVQAVAGGQQAIAAGQNFQPMIVRVTDSSSPPNPVFGANVVFQSVVSLPAPASPPISVGGIIITRNPAPVIVSSSQGSVLSGPSGLATFQPSTAGQPGAVQVQGSMAAGAGTFRFLLRSF